MRNPLGWFERIILIAMLIVGTIHGTWVLLRPKPVPRVSMLSSIRTVICTPGRRELELLNTVKVEAAVLRKAKTVAERLGMPVSTRIIKVLEKAVERDLDRNVDRICKRLLKEEQKGGGEEKWPHEPFGPLTATHH